METLIEGAKASRRDALVERFAALLEAAGLEPTEIDAVMERLEGDGRDADPRRGRRIRADGIH